MKKLYLNNKDKFWGLAVAIIFVLIGVSFRLFPHLPNFTPLAAIALFAGVYFSKKAALFLPLLIMVVSDIFLGYYQPEVMVSVYGSLLLCVALGFWLRDHKKWYTILGGSVLGAVLFFLITNFSVWLFTPWYTKDFSGVFQCYLMALPFFRNSLLGDIFYTAVFFGGYQAIVFLARKRFSAIRYIFSK